MFHQCWGEPKHCHALSTQFLLLPICVCTNHSIPSFTYLHYWDALLSTYSLFIRVLIFNFKDNLRKQCYPLKLLHLSYSGINCKFGKCIPSSSFMKYLIHAKTGSATIITLMHSASTTYQKLFRKKKALSFNCILYKLITVAKAMRNWTTVVPHNFKWMSADLKLVCTVRDTSFLNNVGIGCSVESE